jgi:hypothetical protein
LVVAVEADVDGCNCRREAKNNAGEQHGGKVW